MFERTPSNPSRPLPAYGPATAVLHGLSLVQLTNLHRKSRVNNYVNLNIHSIAFVIATFSGLAAVAGGPVVDYLCLMD